ncbi:MAG: hypothetical protein AAF446_09390, partial [Pseudomonadota bacterium]
MKQFVSDLALPASAAFRARKQPVLVGLLVFSLLFMLPVAAVSANQQEQQPEQHTRPEPPEDYPETRPQDVVAMSCQMEDPRTDSWLDRTHAYLNRQLCGPAAWFDGFFGDRRADEETPVGSFFRLRNSLRWDESEDLDFNVKFSANIELPRVSERVRLLISRDEDQPGTTNQSDNTSQDQNLETRLGLRFLLNQSGRTQYDLDGTVRVNTDGFNPRLRGRVRHAFGVADDTYVRLTQTGFWEREDGFGVGSRADLEWLPDDDTLVRLTGSGTVSEATDGIDWRTGLIGFRQLNRITAIRSELGAFRRTDGSEKREEVFVNFRFRRAFLRDWLFYENHAPIRATIAADRIDRPGVFRLNFIKQPVTQKSTPKTEIHKHFFAFFT